MIFALAGSARKRTESGNRQGKCCRNLFSVHMPTQTSFPSAQRSRVMAAIHSRGNRNTELKLLQILRAHSIKGWRRHLPIPGRPDFAFPKERVAVFVDGCFWHGCQKHCRRPKSNTDFWTPKIDRNISRDRQVNRLLKRAGWKVLRVWEHGLDRPAIAASRVKRALQSQTRKIRTP